jgi:4-amino-4-deoxy-L-arabinose transferase-like glycosyltransferase
MWDLEGLEYFWGPAPILSESFLLWVFDTTSIVPFRVLNILIGCGTIPLAYLVGKKYYSQKAGLLAAALVALNPMTTFNSAIGMTETFAVFFLILGIYFYRDKPFFSGLALAVASLSRAEFWVISIGMIAAYLVFERSTTKAIPSAVGWLLIMGPYFIHVRSATGNPFYSFYWNFLGNIAGVWTPWYVAPQVRAIFTILLAASMIGLLLLLKYRKRIQTYIIPAVFLAFVAYHGLVYTATGLAPLFERFFLLDVVVGSILLAYVATKTKGLKVIAIVLIALEVASFAVAIPYYSSLQSDINGLYGVADQIGARYQGGTVLSDMPMITYRLVNHWRLSERNILGTIYMPKEDTITGLKWLITNNVTWLVVADPKGQSTLIFLEHAGNNSTQFLHLVYAFSGAQVYEVDYKAL